MKIDIYELPIHWTAQPTQLQLAKLATAFNDNFLAWCLFIRPAMTGFKLYAVEVEMPGEEDEELSAVDKERMKCFIYGYAAAIFNN